MIPAVLIVIVLALLAGRFTGGRVRRLASLEPRALPLVLGGLAVLVVAPWLDLHGAGDRALIALTYALVAGFLLANLRSSNRWIRGGIVVLILGWSLNALAIGLNGGMPLSLDAYARSGQTARPTPGEGGFFKLVIEDDGTRLRALGDVIPFQPLRQVYSAGDLVLLAGLAIVLAAGMHDRGREQHHFPSRAPSG